MRRGIQNSMSRTQQLIVLGSSRVRRGFRIRNVEQRTRLLLICMSKAGGFRGITIGISHHDSLWSLKNVTFALPWNKATRHEAWIGAERWSFVVIYHNICVNCWRMGCGSKKSWDSKFRSWTFLNSEPALPTQNKFTDYPGDGKKVGSMCSNMGPTHYPVTGPAQCQPVPVAVGTKVWPTFKQTLQPSGMYKTQPHVMSCSSQLSCRAREIGVDRMRMSAAWVNDRCADKTVEPGECQKLWASAVYGVFHQECRF